MRKTVSTLLMLFVLAPLAWSEDAPRTGFFRTSVTPVELLGEDGAKMVSSVFAPDEKLTWQLLVPKHYDPAKPAAVMVFIGFAEWGAGKKEWNDILADHNMIWKDRRKMRRVADAYKAAGVVNTEVVSVANVNRQMPGSSYFEQAVEFLEARPQASGESQ